LFVGLASIPDPDLVLPTIAQGLGVREAGDEPPAGRLTASERDKRLLPVLDDGTESVSMAAAQSAHASCHPHVSTVQYGQVVKSAIRTPPRSFAPDVSNEPRSSSSGVVLRL
jgi:hypothetical protein